MTTIILIATPPLLLFAFLLGMKLSGRQPARLMVNTYTSLLLLLYFLATTGLGIFWVANQHLPVFDLHYLFGYVAALLACIHVYQNRKQIRIRFKPRPCRTNAPSPGKPATALKGKLAAAAVAGIVCFWVGMQLGNNSISVYPQQSKPGSSSESNPVQGKNGQAVPKSAPAVDRQIIEHGKNKTPLAVYYHNTTKNTRWNVVQNPGGLDWSKRPEVFKTYPAGRNLPLPQPDLERTDQTGQVIDRQRKTVCAFEPDRMTAAELSSVLMLNNGVTGKLEYPGVKYYLRSAPSAGALYPTITYVLVNTVEGIEPGLYHYRVKEHELHLIDPDPGLAEKLQDTVPSPALLENADVVFIYAANYYRCCWKYGKRAYRYILLDAGHVAKNALLGAETFGYQGNPIGCFDDRRVNALLRVDDNEEGALLLLPLGKGTKAGPVTLERAVKAAPQTLSGKADELVLFAHGRTYLELGGPLQYVAPTATGRIYGKSYPALPIVDLPDTYQAGSSLPSSIMNRRSVRNWDDEPMAITQLSSLLYYSFGVKNENGEYLADPGIEGPSLLNLYLVVNKVEGLEAGVYCYNRQRHNLSQIQGGDFHRPVFEASLFQEVVGRSGVCFVLTTSNALLDHRHGDRSLRYAGIEAGMIGENIYLQTQALGLGCTGIGAYFDDEVSTLIKVPPEEEAITYLLAAGVKKNP
ncbi:MAG: SagB/ThcOx family dehydrogenase [Kiritimatiellales bacterium]|nr:SagB/ThcOx family dehydrogenase [Kiritimatiellales bacterium]